MKKKLITYSLLILGLVGSTKLVYCQSTFDKILKLTYHFEEAEPLKMSEFISEISYIPLETNSQCLLGNMWIFAFDKDILIKSSDSSEGIYRFNAQGEYLNKIGRKGRGPNEYYGCSDIFLQHDTVYVVSTFSKAILCYSLSGEFLKRYKLDIENRPKHVVQLPNKSYMVSLSTTSKFGNLLKTDRKFEIQTGFLKELPMANSPQPSRFQKTKNSIYYFHNFHDTIYDITNGSPIPSIVIDYGKYRIANQKRSVDPQNNLILNTPSILDFNASDNYFKLNLFYPYKEGIYSTLYRISDGKQFIWSKLINDVDDGTLDRWHGFLAGDRLIFHLMPLTILERYGKMTKEEKLNPANSGFVKMASKISAESNPVIMVCKIK